LRVPHAVQRASGAPLMRGITKPEVPGAAHYS